MTRWKLTRLLARSVVLGTLGAIAACAHAPATQQMSILDAIDNQQRLQGPSSCAELNATAVCEKSTRLDGDRECRCVDSRALTGSGAFRL